GVIVAQHRNGTKPIVRNGLQHHPPRALISVGVDLCAYGRAVPISEQLQLLEPLVEAMRRQSVHRRMLMEVDEHVCRKLVQLPFAYRIGIESLPQPGVAEVAEEEQALVEIAREDLRRSETVRKQPFGYGKKRPRVLVRRRR